MIILVFGLPGSGKSFFAAHLAKRLNAEYFNSDRLRKKMFDKRTYTNEEKEMVYDEMLLRMKDAVKKGKNVVLDATFYKSTIRKKFIEEAKNIDNIIFIEVQADESMIKERLQRPREDSEADFEVYKKIKKEWEPLSEVHLILESTNDNIGEMLETTSNYLFNKDDKRAN